MYILLSLSTVTQVQVVSLVVRVTCYQVWYPSFADLRVRSCVLFLNDFFLSSRTLTMRTTSDIPFRGSCRLPFLSTFSASGIRPQMYSSALRKLRGAPEYICQAAP